MKKLTLILIPLLLLSCKQQNISYFQEVEKKIGPEMSINTTDYQLKIEPEDILSIVVSNPLNPGAVAIFHLPTIAFASTSSSKIESIQSLQTYTVDDQGNIDFPILGAVHVAGLTRNQLTQLLKEKISAYVSDPIVTVQLLSGKVAVMGEVAKPGNIGIPSDHITILEAIGSAGDLTIFGNRKNVLLIRDDAGKRTFTRIDLTAPDLFASPFYYLKQNDVIYVEPNKSQQGASAFSALSSYRLSVAATITSAVSVVASMLIALLINRN